MRIFGSMPVGEFRVGISEPVGRWSVANYPIEHKIVFVLIAAACLVFASRYWPQSQPSVSVTAPAADMAAMKAADRECPNDGSHNLIRDANDEDKWVCVAE